MAQLFHVFIHILQTLAPLACSITCISTAGRFRSDQVPVELIEQILTSQLFPTISTAADHGSFETPLPTAIKNNLKQEQHLALQ
jgi:hypothetical protein